MAHDVWLERCLGVAPSPEVREALVLQEAAYAVLFCLENTLRGLVTDEMQRVGGARWWKQRVPGDIHRAAKEKARADLHNASLGGCICHLICYTDLPELRKIICRKDNWEDCFEAIFQNRSHLESELEQLDRIRNRVAHNRYVEQSDLERAHGTWQFLRNRLSGRDAGALMAAAVKPAFPLDAIRQLREQIRTVRDAAMESARCAWDEKTARDTIDAPWFDADVLSAEPEPIVSACNLLMEYCAKPRCKGDGPQIRSWTAEVGLLSTCERALAVVQTILEE